MEVSRPRLPAPTAFVLAGGGSLGAVEVGMLQALLDWGESPAFVVGASAGAINAAYFAAVPTRDGVEELRRVWCSIRRRDVLPFGLPGLLGALFGRKGHLVDSRGLRHVLERNLPCDHLEHAVIPVHIVATELLSGHEVILSSGPAVEAVLASTAIPGVFPPVKIGSHTLVDGGVANNAPISVAIALGALSVIVLPTGFACALPEEPRGAVARAMHAVSMLVARQLFRDAEHWRNSHIQLRIVPSLCPLGVSPYDYSAADALIQRAHDNTKLWLENGGLEFVMLPDELRMHHH